MRDCFRHSFVEGVDKKSKFRSWGVKTLPGNYVHTSMDPISGLSIRVRASDPGAVWKVKMIEFFGSEAHCRKSSREKPLFKSAQLANTTFGDGTWCREDGKVILGYHFFWTSERDTNQDPGPPYAQNSFRISSVLEEKLYTFS